MKRIFKKAIPYVIVFIVINVILKMTSNFYTQEKRYRSRIESSIDQHNKIIFLGDSHAETIHHINADKRYGNLAFGADGIKEMYIKSLIALEYIPNIEYVFICTEPQMFNSSISPNSVFLNPFLSKIEDSLNVYDKSKLDLLVEKVPLFNDNYLKFINNKVFNDLRSIGQAEDDVNWPDLSDVEKSAIASKMGKVDHTGILLNDQDVLIFKKMVGNFKKKGVKTIGIRYPVHENYINQCDENDLKKVDKLIEQLRLDYNLDYSVELKNPKLFKDADHLNKEGVQRLTELIKKDTGIDLL